MGGDYRDLAKPQHCLLDLFSERECYYATNEGQAIVGGTNSSVVDPSIKIPNYQYVGF